MSTWLSVIATRTSYDLIRRSRPECIRPASINIIESTVCTVGAVWFLLFAVPSKITRGDLLGAAKTICSLCSDNPMHNHLQLAELDRDLRAECGVVVHQLDVRIKARAVGQILDFREEEGGALFALDSERL